VIDPYDREDAALDREHRRARFGGNWFTASSGMIGLSTENAPVMMNWMPTMTRACVAMHAAAPFVSAAADFCIAPLCSSRITLPLHPADFRTSIPHFYKA
jgi:hypothetical protein